MRVIRQHPNPVLMGKDEDIVCAPGDRGMTRREDRSEPTAGVPALLPSGPQGS